MSKAKVSLFGQSRGIVIDPSATEGAVVGQNLRLANGTLVTEAMLFGSDDEGPDEFAYTVWRLILEIPPNIVKLAALTGDGYPYRTDDGEWALRHSGRAVIDFSFGDASPLEVFVPAEDSHLAVIRVNIEVAFDGAGAEITLGSQLDPDLYVAVGDVDPTAAAGYEVVPDVSLAASEGIWLTITPGSGATAGSGQIIIETIPVAES